MMEKIITIDERDARRLAQIKRILEEATETWDRAVKLIIPDYLNGDEFRGKNVDIVSLNPESKTMTVKVEDEPGGDKG